MKKKNILIGITGGIAVYKICSLVNILIKEGANVKVIMTKAATNFVGPITFQSLTKNPVYSDMFKIINQEEVEHISLAKWADLMLIAPATANTISKISHGVADNLLTTVVLALPAEKRVLIVPAMNTQMWTNPIFQKNIDSLNSHEGRFYLVEPRKGILACGDKGSGKIASNEEIVKGIKNTLL